MLQRATLTLMFGFALSGCSSGDPEFERLVLAHDTSVEEIRELNAGHASAVGGSEDMAAIAELEREHHGRMTDAMARMRSTIEAMEMCDHVCCLGGDRMMRSMGDEIDGHRGRMDEMPAIDDAHGEENRHQARMRDELGDMDVDNRGMHEMMNMGFDMGCPGSE